ncbi:Rhodanese-like domain-containing protein 15, chloroplastic [Linum perenne]
MYRIGSGSRLAKNPKFVEQVSSQFGKYNELIVGCQLGKRSMMAATDLLAAGFMAVTDIAGGYAAWTQNGLPIEK